MRFAFTVEVAERETDEPEHVDDYTRDVMQAEVAVDAAVAIAGTTIAVATTRRVLVPIVCSCGSTRCSAIGLYGHPSPVYEAQIAPLGGQPAKDRRAVELKVGRR